MSTHNIGFYEEISQIITYHQISSNTHLISSDPLYILSTLLACSELFMNEYLCLPGYI